MLTPKKTKRPLRPPQKKNNESAHNFENPPTRADAHLSALGRVEGRAVRRPRPPAATAGVKVNDKNATFAEPERLQKVLAQLGIG